MQLKNLTILVTGGAGFIGSHLTEMLAKQNRVIVFDNFTSSAVSPKELASWKNVTVTRGDILNQKLLEKTLQNVDIVFHLAVACVRLSLSNDTYVHTVNATGTLSALRAAKNAGIKRFIYVSSSEVYGSAKQTRIAETHPINPTTVYGMSKYVGELYTMYFYHHEGVPALVIRPFNTYGPRSHFEGVYGEVIPRFVVRALSGKNPIIFGDGKQTRDFTYISDTVTGIMRAAETNKLLGTATNIAYGKEVSILRIARIICRQTGIPFAPIMKPARPNDVRRLPANTARAQKLFSWHPRIPVEEGLKRYVSWVKETYPHPTKLLRRIPETNW